MKSFTALKFILAVIVATIQLTLSAQDVIVTYAGDTINCNITKLEADYIYFKYVHNNEVRDMLLPRASINKYQTNYFSQPALSPAAVHAERDSVLSKFQKRIAVNGGLAYRISPISGNVPDYMESYYNKFRSGYSLSADLCIYPKGNLGFGILYSRYISKMSEKIYNDYYSDDLKISFFCPMLSLRRLNSDKSGAFVTSIGAGYMTYYQKQFYKKRLVYDGHTIGSCLNIGYDVAISKSVSIGLQLSAYIGVLSKISVNDYSTTQTVELEGSEKEGLSRLDISLGVRFN